MNSNRDYGAFIHAAIVFIFGLLAIWLKSIGYITGGLILLWWVAGFFGGREAGQHDDTPFTLHQISEWLPSQLIAAGFTWYILGY